jgi:ornithine cyclodeaminase/alanine dehydrogenase-like protein (mu-crystallin family)
VHQLTESQVVNLLHPAQLVAALEAAFRDRYPSVEIPERTHLNTTDGVFLTMSCFDPGTQALGMKLVAVSRTSDPPVQATYLLLESRTANIVATLAANHLTEMRTAATSALATRHLAREDATTLAIFGTGREARAHLKLFTQLARYSAILICGHTPAKSEAFAAEFAATLPIRAADSYTCATQGDVICTCTNSPDPLFDGKLLRPGTHLNLVGSFQPEVREVDSVAICRARIYVDTHAGALAEAGDILIPMGERLITPEHIVSDLHQLLSRKRPGRANRAEITIFKSVGCALEDLVAAELVEQAARNAVDRPL